MKGKWTALEVRLWDHDWGVMAGAGLGPEDLGGDPAWQKRKKGNMRAREGRSWRDSLILRRKTE